tara:strand:- start:886 stop:1092 length:207 start_codon:yes stop_codon:yes gene_type:complete
MTNKNQPGYDAKGQELGTETIHVTLPRGIMDVEVLMGQANYRSANNSTPPQSSLCPGSQLEESADSGE